MTKKGKAKKHGSASSAPGPAPAQPVQPAQSAPLSSPSPKASASTRAFEESLVMPPPQPYSLASTATSSECLAFNCVHPTFSPICTNTLGLMWHQRSPKQRKAALDFVTHASILEELSKNGFWDPESVALSVTSPDFELLQIKCLYLAEPSATLKTTSKKELPSQSAEYIRLIKEFFVQKIENIVQLEEWVIPRHLLYFYDQRLGMMSYQQGVENHPSHRDPSKFETLAAVKANLKSAQLAHALKLTKLYGPHPMLWVPMHPIMTAKFGRTPTPAISQQESDQLQVQVEATRHLPVPFTVWDSKRKSFRHFCMCCQEYLEDTLFYESTIIEETPLCRRCIQTRYIHDSPYYSHKYRAEDISKHTEVALIKTILRMLETSVLGNLQLEANPTDREALMSRFMGMRNDLFHRAGVLEGAPPAFSSFEAGLECLQLCKAMLSIEPKLTELLVVKAHVHGILGQFFEYAKTYELAYKLADCHDTRLALDRGLNNSSVVNSASLRKPYEALLGIMKRMRSGGWDGYSECPWQYPRLVFPRYAVGSAPVLTPVKPAADMIYFHLDQLSWPEHAETSDFTRLWHADFDLAGKKEIRILDSMNPAWFDQEFCLKSPVIVKLSQSQDPASQTPLTQAQRVADVLLYHGLSVQVVSSNKLRLFGLKNVGEHTLRQSLPLSGTAPSGSSASVGSSAAAAAALLDVPVPVGGGSSSSVSGVVALATPGPSSMSVSPPLSAWSTATEQSGIATQTAPMCVPEDNPFHPITQMLSPDGFVSTEDALRAYKSFSFPPLSEPDASGEMASSKFWSLLKSFLNLRCANPECTETDVPLRVCGKCVVCFYCSKGCQQNHWKEHRKTCVNRIKLLRQSKFYEEHRASIDAAFREAYFAHQP
eukprot:ANDGO_06255.mRNA.1 hypothetical protein